MTTLLCLGLGYCARRYVADFGASYSRIIGTSRVPGITHASDATAANPAVMRLTFDGTEASAALSSAIHDAHRILISIPPLAAGDPVLAALAGEFEQLSRLQSVVYLSTVGVYGDHSGADVRESTSPAPISCRSHARLAAERAWQELGAKIRKPVTILRLAGIYGPGRNALVKLAQGRAMRIVKRHQVFNRIHVADVAQAIDAAFVLHANGVFNVADDKPCPPDEIIVYSARLMGIEPPPAISFAQAEPLLSPLARSFYAENRRVRNDKLKEVLGVRLIYPTYQAGLGALCDGKRQTTVW